MMYPVKAVARSVCASSGNANRYVYSASLHNAFEFPLNPCRRRQRAFALNRELSEELRANRGLEMVNVSTAMLRELLAESTSYRWQGQGFDSFTDLRFVLFPD